jgi:hypothetical protein
VSDLFCIPDAITDALSDIAVYALITTVDQEWSWVEEDGKGVAVHRKAGVRGMEHTDLAGRAPPQPVCATRMAAHTWR